MTEGRVWNGEDDGREGHAKEDEEEALLPEEVADGAGDGEPPLLGLRGVPAVRLGLRLVPSVDEPGQAHFRLRGTAGEQGRTGLDCMIRRKRKIPGAFLQKVEGLSVGKTFLG